MFCMAYWSKGSILHTRVAFCLEALDQLKQLSSIFVNFLYLILFFDGGFLFSHCFCTCLQCLGFLCWNPESWQISFRSGWGSWILFLCFEGGSIIRFSKGECFLFPFSFVKQSGKLFYGFVLCIFWRWLINLLFLKQFDLMLEPKALMPIAHCVLHA